MLIVLIGPKGSGKSHIGRVLEKRLGILFFNVEPFWMSYYAECQTAARQPVISEGIAKTHPRIAETLRAHEHVCVETTGASAEILNDLLSLEQPAKTLIARVSAPLQLCLERIARRDQRKQIPMDVATIRKIHGLSESVQLQPDLLLDNAPLTEDEIISLFNGALTRRAGSAAQLKH
jgi:shikimate kinase